MTTTVTTSHQLITRPDGKSRYLVWGTCAGCNWRTHGAMSGGLVHTLYSRAHPPTDEGDTES